MAVKHEEYDGEDEKTIVAATTDIASCASPRHSRAMGTADVRHDILHTEE